MFLQRSNEMCLKYEYIIFVEHGNHVLCMLGVMLMECSLNPQKTGHMDVLATSHETCREH
jgi:hypothetical protein